MLPSRVMLAANLELKEGIVPVSQPASNVMLDSYWFPSWELLRALRADPNSAHDAAGPMVREC
jgi:hypothetical protein